jgi:hypothetical protein
VALAASYDVKTVARRRARRRTPETLWAAAPVEARVTSPALAKLAGSYLNITLDEFLATDAAKIVTDIRKLAASVLSQVQP